ncbi:unnamed protein product [Paramecium octaurelia]|uniref:Transmembrane protein n=1 Tax=Paramecium octaurelia TaxID=43137 RepID=A0A8S1XMG9_PAROT|nr:unnamed protein product [Paramecium octaurelia]
MPRQYHEKPPSSKLMSFFIVISNQAAISLVFGYFQTRLKLKQLTYLSCQHFLNFVLYHFSSLLCCSILDSKSLNSCCLHYLQVVVRRIRLLFIQMKKIFEFLITLKQLVFFQIKAILHLYKQECIGYACELWDSKRIKQEDKSNVVLNEKCTRLPTRVQSNLLSQSIVQVNIYGSFVEIYFKQKICQFILINFTRIIRHANSDIFYVSEKVNRNIL